MRFKNWFKINENRKELAHHYSNLLKDVPQDPIHHPEGSALIHTQLVRKAIPKAIQELNKLKFIEPFSKILENLDFSVSEEEMQILVMSAWLHDIGKASATTVNKDTGKIQAIGHQDPEHYLPQLNKIQNFAPQEVVEFYQKNSQIINFLIERHMDFVNKDGFPSGFIKSNFENGVIKNSKEIKLLLILMWADKMGRKPENTILSAIQKNAERLQISSERSQKFKPIVQKTSFSGSPKEFNDLLLSRNLNSLQRKSALKNKFPELSDLELSNLVF
ncbi:MAG: hypothetical protein EKK64_00460 [Neisseriaceae bacterium]|nr:MAG: hypothetical protein EKK64_00460 [Neisseriaceae bacterium]